MNKTRVVVIMLLVGFVFGISSCKNYRKKTFLDFEFGMTYQEYINHAQALERSGFIEINKTHPDVFEYSLKMSEGKYVFHHVRMQFIYGRLTTIYADIVYNLNDYDKKQLFNVYQSKYQKPEYPFEKNTKDNYWYTSWDFGETDLTFLLSDNHETFGNGVITFSATGSLRDNIEEKGKKEKGVIDVNNKY